MTVLAFLIGICLALVCASAWELHLANRVITKLLKALHEDDSV